MRAPRRLRLPEGVIAYASRAAWVAVTVGLTVGGVVLLYSGPELLPA
jgi:hypothetical protein